MAEKKSNKGLVTVLIIVGIVMIVLVTMVVRYLLSLNKETIDDRPYVSAEYPEERDIEVYTQQIGSIMPAEYVAVIPMMAGEILKVNFDIGDHVNKDDVLCVVNSDALESLQIQLDSAQIQLDDANTTLERMKALYAAGAISEQSMEQTESAVKGAQLQYDAAKTQYELQEKYSNIKAPISGVIESKNAEVHEFATQGSPIAVITAEGETEVSFGISEDSYKSLKVDDTVEVISGGKEYDATVTEIGTMLSSSGLHEVKARIKDGSDLTTGSRAKVSHIKDKAQGVLSIPVDAVYYAGSQAFVYVLKDNVAVKKLFTPGINDGAYIEIADGITKEDKVITTWDKELYDTAQVIEE